jgi:hypothetical protein
MLILDPLDDGRTLARQSRKLAADDVKIGGDEASRSPNNTSRSACGYGRGRYRSALTRPNTAVLPAMARAREITATAVTPLPCRSILRPNRMSCQIEAMLMLG